MKSNLIIGVDGGGTKTVATAALPDGSILGRETGPGINYHNIGMDKARENLRRVVEALLNRCGAAGYDHLIIGMSALDREADEDTVRRFKSDCFDTGSFRMYSDAYVALICATLGKPGMIVICGTGSMVLLLDGQGVQHVALGWGALMGDAGSSYTIAVEGLRAAISAWEGMRPITSLTDAVMRYYDLLAPRDLIDRICNPATSTEQIAQFARVVLEEARKGDPAAIDIVRENMTYLAKKCAMMIREHPEASKVALYGGVFTHNPWVCDLFKDTLIKSNPNANVCRLEYPPEVGAVLCHFINQNALTERVLCRVRETFKEALS